MQQMIKLLTKVLQKENPSLEKPECRVGQVGHSAGVDMQLNVDNVLVEGGRLE